MLWFVRRSLYIQKWEWDKNQNGLTCGLIMNEPSPTTLGPFVALSTLFSNGLCVFLAFSRFNGLRVSPQMTQVLLTSRYMMAQPMSVIIRKMGLATLKTLTRRCRKR